MDIDKEEFLKVPIGYIYEDLTGLMEKNVPNGYLRFDGIERKNVDYPQLIEVLKDSLFQKYVKQTTFVLPSFWDGAYKGNLFIKAY